MPSNIRKRPSAKIFIKTTPMPISEEHLELLRKMERPDDLVEARILSESPRPLRVHSELTPSEGSILSNNNKIYFTNQRSAKKNKKNGKRSIDIYNSTPGYFDDFGNFILSESDKISTPWVIKDETNSSSVKGPFTSEEIKKMVADGSLNGKWIKRPFDRGFVLADDLVAEHPTFYNAKNLNKYFSMHQIVEDEPLPQNDDFYSEVITKVGSTKLNNFIKSNNISASFVQLVKAIKNLTKNDAIKAIRTITGLGVVENTMLVELLVESANTQILSDVDKDGFMMNTGGNSHRRYHRK